MIVRTRSVTRTSWHRLCRALEDTQHQRRGLFSFVYRMYHPWRAIHRRPAVRVCAAGHAITSPHRSHGKRRTRNHSYAACARERVSLTCIASNSEFTGEPQLHRNKERARGDFRNHPIQSPSYYGSGPWPWVSG